MWQISNLKGTYSITQWFLDTWNVFNVVCSTYFQLALNAIAMICSQCQLCIDGYRSIQVNFGYAIMGDGWTNQRQGL